jgi:hypothetical protein
VHNLLGITGLFPTVIAGIENVKEGKRRNICKYMAANQQKMGTEPIFGKWCV